MSFERSRSVSQLIKSEQGMRTYVREFLLFIFIAVLMRAAMLETGTTLGYIPYIDDTIVQASTFVKRYLLVYLY